MRMIQAVIRTEKEETVVSALAKAHLPAVTKWDVVGRGKQQGIRVGGQVYHELAKTILLIVVNDDQVESVLQIIRDAAFTGSPGDGKIFVTLVDAVYTVRTGKQEI